MLVNSQVTSLDLSSRQKETAPCLDKTFGEPALLNKRSSCGGKKELLCQRVLDLESHLRTQATAMASSDQSERKLLGIGRGLGRGSANKPGAMANGNDSTNGSRFTSDFFSGSAEVQGSTFDSEDVSWASFGSTSNNNRSSFGDGGSRGKACFKCKEEGHMSRDCPNADSFGGGRRSGGGSSGGCRKCGEEGHFARECPQGGGGSSGGCRKCGEEGHFARECPQGGGGSSGGCRKCGEEGHFARDCPQGGGAREKKGCFRCGEDGHMAKDCTQPPAAGDKPKSTYIPPDLSQDEAALFNSTHAGINFEKYNEIPVEVSGHNPVSFISSFEEAGFAEQCMRNIKRANYKDPTPVQKYAIPIIMAGRDLMACAQTGSGKTAAFVLPVITAILQKGQRSDSNLVQYPQAVIVAPTRELAIQINTDALKFALGTNVRCKVVYGGTSVRYQMNDVQKGVDILVGTPGRLLDFVDKGCINLSKVEFLILDEADRMLDMGFEPEMRRLVGNPNMPAKTERLTLMFSATFPTEIQKLAADFLNNYLFVTVGQVGGANTDVTQELFEVERLKKRDHLCNILSDSGKDRVLVFVEQKRNADFLATYLSSKGFPTTSIHGDREQQEREEALRDFKSGEKPVLIATSVAARGLDIPDVKHVINYDLPSNIDEYVHRIGRTGRCGNLGKATSFFSADADQPLAKKLLNILKEAKQTVPAFLEEYVSGVGGDYGYDSSRFASTDIRRGRGGFSNESAFNGEGDCETWD